MKKISLGYKLFLLLFAIISSYAVFSVLFVNLYLKDMLKKHFVNMGNALAATVSNHVTYDILINDFVGAYSVFEDTMANNPEVSYFFIEKDGHVIVHTFKEGLPKGLLNVGHEKGRINHIIVETGDETYYDFSAPIFQGRAGTLRLGISGKKIMEMTDRAVRSLIYIAVAMGILALALSILVSRKLIRPLTVLASSAIKASDGRYEDVTVIDSGDEVEELSRAFNKMVEAVKIREKELTKVNKELEDVNIKLHEYIDELHRTKDELVKSKQDKAVLETSRTIIHHMRQPLTYLTMAIEMFTDEIQEGAFDSDALQKKLFAIEEASQNVAVLLRKFEKLSQYKIVEYTDKTKIIDINIEGE